MYISGLSSSWLNAVITIDRSLLSRSVLSLVVVSCLHAQAHAQQVDCLGVIDGPDMPGTPCDDGNPNTINDVLTPWCVCEGACLGTDLDCLCVPDGPDMPGTPCNDHDPITLTDHWSPDCECLDGGNVLSGRVYLDVDQNGVYSAGDHLISNRMVYAGPERTTMTSSENGDFQFSLPAGSYSLSVQNGPFDQQAVPYPIQEFIGLESTSEGHDIAMTATSYEADLSIRMTWTVARPGFNYAVWLNYNNEGTIPAGGTLSFTYDTQQDFISAEGSPDVSGNTLTWDVNELHPGQAGVFQVILNTPASVPLGTPLSHSAFIDAVPPDGVPENDMFILHHLVTGPFDPNDKLVTPAVLTPQEVQDGRSLIYTIRFQNTGTYLAENVRITDQISGLLDLSSFEFIGSSHHCEVTMNDDWLGFRFDGIMLPDSGSNEPESHGFVMFKIRSSPDLQLGDVVENIASIYFDYNDPIITEPAVVTIDDAAGWNEVVAEPLRVWPNPAGEVLYYHLPRRSVSGNLSALVIDLSGKVVRSARVERSEAAVNSLNLDGLPAGVYHLQVRATDRTMNSAFIKY